MSEIFKINEVEYECEFKFKNSDNQEVKVTKSALRGLTFIDNFFEPFMNGSVSIANPYDLFEEKYLLRGDGRDEFHVKINPKKYPKDKIDMVFVLTEENNFGKPEVRSENIKKFKFIHKDVIPFMDRIPYGKSFSGKAGTILKDIFKDLLGDNSVDSEEWEEGDFILTYHPPLTFRYIDLVYYLLKYYYAKDGELHSKGFIHFDKDSNRYKLKMVGKLFEENKDNLLDAFVVSNATTNDSNNPNNPPPDADVDIYNSALKNISPSTPMYNWNNDYFINTVVHGYDPIFGVHKMRLLKLEDLENKWKTKYVDSFKLIGGSPKSFVVKNKTTKEKFRHIRTPYPVEDSVKMAEADFYNKLTFTNLQCVFANIGSLSRNGGKFIDVVKIGDDIFKGDGKLLGRWFVKELRHVFLGDGYTNEFICCKTYVGPNNNINNNAE